MKVFKFGGASVNSIERIQNVAAIIKEYSSDELMIIISAMGKTTNALEKVVEAFFAGDKENALQLFDGIKKQHTTTAKYLLVTHFNACIEQLNSFFTEVEWLLHDKPVREFDYYYDQVVCVGELLSTCIVSYYLNEMKVANKWIDVRDIIRTDDNFRDATIDWTYTAQRVNESIVPLFAANKIIITQGFIGATDENESTTLGREGSDFTAAIFANLLNAESQTIWKDVEAVMSADPKQFPDAEIIHELSFDEVIEMAYYGAQIIHPKTIKPLQNKGIPLHVKSFIDPSLPGTVIYKKQPKHLPPIIIIKQNQALLHLHSQDFSFVGEKPMSRLYEFFAHNKIRPNLIQTGAISLQVCLDDKSDKIDHLAAEASNIFDVQVEKGLSLLTIRHYTETLLDEMTTGKEIVLKQQDRQTVQVLYKN
ncbi:aspartate kinase [Panacibacter ginsenosidivorans]|uniref:Aspartokinase n=1 Tax=Panacibacter ginsenosidivorans TaxID=1813871 RepID=A0A5B8VFY2_9BACT|nr:aspartate kinase [Panacibacter ginsenosidivorans]QEC69912.1 aspartate kinase [Panacibacter ginsenosidivorans]